MGVASIKSTFNVVGAAGGLTCTRATLGYDTVDGVEWQVITFSGKRESGEAFSLEKRVAAGIDPETVARDAANELIG